MGPVAANGARPDQDSAGPAQGGTSGQVAASRNVMKGWGGSVPFPAFSRERLVEVSACRALALWRAEGGRRRHV